MNSIFSALRVHRVPEWDKLETPLSVSNALLAALVATPESIVEPALLVTFILYTKFFGTGEAVDAFESSFLRAGVAFKARRLHGDAAALAQLERGWVQSFIARFCERAGLDQARFAAALHRSSSFFVPPRSSFSARLALIEFLSWFCWVLTYHRKHNGCSNAFLARIFAQVLVKPRKAGLNTLFYAEEFLRAAAPQLVPVASSEDTWGLMHPAAFSLPDMSEHFAAAPRAAAPVAPAPAPAPRSPDTPRNSRLLQVLFGHNMFTWTLLKNFNFMPIAFLAAPFRSCAAALRGPMFPQLGLWLQLSFNWHVVELDTETDMSEPSTILAHQSEPLSPDELWECGRVSISSTELLVPESLVNLFRELKMRPNDAQFQKSLRKIGFGTRRAPPWRDPGSQRVWGHKQFTDARIVLGYFLLTHQQLAAATPQAGGNACAVPRSQQRQNMCAPRHAQIHGRRPSLLLHCSRATSNALDIAMFTLRARKPVVSPFAAPGRARASGHPLSIPDMVRQTRMAGPPQTLRAFLRPMRTDPASAALADRIAKICQLHPTEIVRDFRKVSREDVFQNARISYRQFLRLRDDSTRRETQNVEFQMRRNELLCLYQLFRSAFQVHAATSIQAAWRGTIVRKRLNSLNPNVELTLRDCRRSLCGKTRLDDAVDTTMKQFLELPTQSHPSARRHCALQTIVLQRKSGGVDRADADVCLRTLKKLDAESEQRVRWQLMCCSFPKDQERIVQERLAQRSRRADIKAVLRRFESEHARVYGRPPRKRDRAHLSFLYSLLHETKESFAATPGAPPRGAWSPGPWFAAAAVPKWTELSKLQIVDEISCRYSNGVLLLYRGRKLMEEAPPSEPAALYEFRRDIQDCLRSFKNNYKELCRFTDCVHRSELLERGCRIPSDWRHSFADFYWTLYDFYKNVKERIDAVARRPLRPHALK